MQQLSDKQILNISHLNSEVVKVNATRTNQSIHELSICILCDHHLLDQKILYDICLREAHDGKVNILFINPLRVYKDEDGGQKKSEIYLTRLEGCRHVLSSEKSDLTHIHLYDEEQSDIHAIIIGVMRRLELMIDDEVNEITNLFSNL